MGAEGIVADADVADAGLIPGTGYAPFRGGPLTCLKNIITKTAEETFL